MKDQVKKESSKEDSKVVDKKVITLPALMTVKELSDQLKLSVTDVISSLIKNGVPAAINETIDYDAAAIVALGFDMKTKPEKIKQEKKLTAKNIIGKENKKNLINRPPVVTIMGHVDHGKTLLLDAIRESNIRAGESGGITQHIGAYQIEKEGKQITFLDTPGHEAFEAMRARGASVTDIIVLVVAADDKIQPQAIESIKHAQEASLPIIVAINKIDKPEADPERIKKDLSDYDLVPEDWGGKTIFVQVSAKTKEGIPELLEMIILATDMEELKANPKAKAVGTVLESHIDKGKGSVATVLIMNGTLKIMDNFVIGENYGKLRTMENFLGNRINKALPSMPVVISGFSGLPQVGDILEVVEDEQEAKLRSAEAFKQKNVKRINVKEKKPKESESKYELKIVLKTDVSGSLEAIEEGLSKINIDDVGVNIIQGSVGDIIESDVLMASSAGGQILGFHVKITPAARKAAKQTKVKITLYKVIYELIRDVRDKMIALLPPEIKEISGGKIKILQIFRSGKGETILGGKVSGGEIDKNVKVKIIRGSEEIGRGVIINLKKGSKDVAKVKSGEECGVSLRSETEMKEQDVLEVIKEEVVKRSF